MRPLLFLIMLCGLGPLAAQSYDEDLLSPEFHRSRREALRALLPDSTCAVFFSAPERHRANDTKYLYHQDPDFYYLTGLTEPNAMLIIFKEPQFPGDSIESNEVIYVQDRNASQESWTGKRLGKSGAEQKLGFKKVFINKEFPEQKIDFHLFRKIYHKELFGDVRDNPNDKGDLYSLIRHFKSKTEGKRSLVEDFSLSGWMATLREIKQPEEIVLLRKAIDITCVAHAEAGRALEPGMKEYQTQAVVEYMFRNAGSEYVGYSTIAGAGENSCILHYETNRKKMQDTDLLVLDAGAEYHGYTADVTRTFPVDGTFSEEQKIIYNIVLEAQEAGIAACQSGNEFRASHKAAAAVIQKRLTELGIIKDQTDVLKYFFHGTSHYLGLDVHDPGSYGRLKPGTLVTVEPGIYIPQGSPCDPKWWNIGVRIEDDILITAEGPQNLSGSLPKKVAEIEALMKEESFLTREQNKK